jgi:hypothetical protein
MPYDSEVPNVVDIVEAEIKELLGIDLKLAGALPSGKPKGCDVDALNEALDKTGVDLSALCLSGGGIRSASFGLGVIQALAKSDLLFQFHYLSTVSGGGYIGSWLTAWRRDEADSAVARDLNSRRDGGEEPAQIEGIRRDSNYLTPQLGLLSADTWTLVTLYVRNLVLNWAVFLPFFMACFMFPRLWMALISLLHAGVAGGMPTLEPGQTFKLTRGAGGVLTTVAVALGIYGRFRRAGQWLTTARFVCYVLVPLVLGAVSFVAAAVVLASIPADPLATTFQAEYLYIGMKWGAAIYFASWLIGRVLSLPHVAARERPIEWLDVLIWTFSGLIVGALAAVAMHAIGTAYVAATGSVAAIQSLDGSIAVFGLSAFVLAYMVGELAYVGLASFSRKGDMDREWLARSSGWLAAIVVGWMVFGAVALYLPGVLHSGWTSLVGASSGLVTLLLGSSARTAATAARQTSRSLTLTQLASIAAVIFAVLLSGLIAYADGQLEAAVLCRGRWFGQGSVLSMVVTDSVLLLMLLLIAVVISAFVNINRFSLHALYRNRLIRAFLGSARSAKRQPDPFTGFDPDDNCHLAATRPKSGGSRLFHVVNAALNVVATSNQAWQQRKAESFTMTRLHCGNPFTGYQPTQTYGGRIAQKGDAFQGGMTLGTAMAISGAAVSPNQGYNSSPLVSLLLMLFNVRLGWWLANPMRRLPGKDGPSLALAPALRELTGHTTDDAKWVYLSDGGHFENLGLYEMVRRRCRQIIVIDADADPECSFEDLGNAVRKIYIDFGVSIDFDKLDIQARQIPPVPGARFALGTIRYPGSDRHGWIIYVKPTYQGTERADIRSYASGSRTFPHETTADQWFSESQLESYRALGASVIESLCSGPLARSSGAILLKDLGPR